MGFCTSSAEAPSNGTSPSLAEKQAGITAGENFRLGRPQMKLKGGSFLFIYLFEKYKVESLLRVRGGGPRLKVQWEARCRSGCLYLLLPGLSWRFYLITFTHLGPAVQSTLWALGLPQIRIWLLSSPSCLVRRGQALTSCCGAVQWGRGGVLKCPLPSTGGRFPNKHALLGHIKLLSTPLPRI